MMLDGLKMVAPSAALLLFAILFFGLMIDAGLFDPLIRKILRRVNGDPLKIAVGTALLSLLVALDGDGTTTYMITCAAMLPLYRRIGMNPMILATVSMLSLSIMSGLSPWGGPATRAIAALGLDASGTSYPCCRPCSEAPPGWYSARSCLAAPNAGASATSGSNPVVAIAISRRS